MVVGLRGCVGSLLGQRRRASTASSVSSGPRRVSTRPTSVSCVAYPSRRQFASSQYVLLPPSGAPRGDASRGGPRGPVRVPAPRVRPRASCGSPARGRCSFSRMRKTLCARGADGPPLCLDKLRVLRFVRATAALVLASGHAGAGLSARNATWLILPVVICLSQRLSHACVSMN